jgi:hypothetical protein
MNGGSENETNFCYEKFHSLKNGQQQRTKSKPIYKKLGYHSSTDDITMSFPNNSQTTTIELNQRYDDSS